MEKEETESQMIFKNNMDYEITEERRSEYRRSSIESAKLKREAMDVSNYDPDPDLHIPRLDPQSLMPKMKSNTMKTLSLFSGGGGLDLGFENAGFDHLASYDIIPICGETLKHNRPNWSVFSGETEGDVKIVNWRKYIGKVDIIHGGPPCQPFSVAGQQAGIQDERNMWGPFVDIVNLIRPVAFVAENVKGLLGSKFSNFVNENIFLPLSDYHIISFTLNAAGFGVPQKRERVFFVGFLDSKCQKRFKIPAYTHSFNHLLESEREQISFPQGSLFEDEKQKCMGVREALGLPDIGIDILAPTIRSAFTGKRNTTSILNSTASAKSLASIKVWGSGVAPERISAFNYPTKNGHFRLSVQDCSILQGFPESWVFCGATYKVLGQIGNSVAPPVAYNIARSLDEALDI